MNAFLRVLLVPLALEAGNVVVHRIAHWTNFANTYTDTSSSILSLAIVFYAGWVISRQTRRTMSAVLAGLVVWAFSLFLVALLMSMEVLLATGLQVGEGPAAIAGFALSSIMVLPGLIAVATMAGFIARKRAT